MDAFLERCYVRVRTAQLKFRPKSISEMGFGHPPLHLIEFKQNFFFQLKF